MNRVTFAERGSWRSVGRGKSRLLWELEIDNTVALASTCNLIVAAAVSCGSDFKILWDGRVVYNSKRVGVRCNHGFIRDRCLLTVERIKSDRVNRSDPDKSTVSSKRQADPG